MEEQAGLRATRALKPRTQDILVAFEDGSDPRPRDKRWPSHKEERAIDPSTAQVPLACARSGRTRPDSISSQDKSNRRRSPLLMTSVGPVGTDTAPRKTPQSWSSTPPLLADPRHHHHPILVSPLSILISLSSILSTSIPSSSVLCPILVLVPPILVGSSRLASYPRRSVSPILILCFVPGVR